MEPTAWHEKASLPPSTPFLPLSHDTGHHVSFPEEGWNPGGELLVSHPETIGLTMDPEGK